MKTIIFIFMSLLSSSAALAQAERSEIRQGNRLYKEGKYTEAEVKYKQAEVKNPLSFEAGFNAAGSLYKQQRFEDAAVGYAKLAQDGSDQKKQADTFYNLGNTNVKMRKLDDSIEAYKEALRRDPSDMQAKFNLAYAQKLKQEDDKNKDQNQDQNKDQNQDNKDQNQDQNNKDQNKDQNKNQDKKDDKQNKDNKDQKDKDKKDQQKQEQQQQQQQDNQRMLNAVQAAEDKTKKKVDEKQAEAVGTSSGKNW